MDKLDTKIGYLSEASGVMGSSKPSISKPPTYSKFKNHQIMPEEESVTNLISENENPVRKSQMRNSGKPPIAKSPL
jgi:hypothetical protein